MSQGLTMGLQYKQMKLKLGTSREISERKQVGDAESMVNEGKGTQNQFGLFGRGGGEV